MFSRILIFIILLTCSLDSYAELMNISFQNTSVKTILEWLAKFSETNMLVSNAVQGYMSFNLKQVSFNQILQTMIDSQQLQIRDEHHILYISPAEAQHSSTNNCDQTTIVFALHNARAAEINKLLQTKPNIVSSNQGIIETDERTNSLIVQDCQQNIPHIRQLLLQLDVPMNQVLIAARVVNIDSDYESQLGIRFNANYNQATNPNVNTDSSNQLQMNLPIIQTNGQLGLALFKLAHGTFVDLELAALESEGHAKIISSPELIATNQQPALIQSGQEIPYQEKTASGATSVTFKKAVLSLKVTPQIIHDDKILLHLQVNQDSRSSKEVLGVPTIDTREINTEVLVTNKQTVALGGIYEETQSNNLQRVPFLASLPLVGALFRYKTTEHDKRELLIFVTPTLIKT